MIEQFVCSNAAVCPMRGVNCPHSTCHEHYAECDASCVTHDGAKCIPFVHNYECKKADECGNLQCPHRAAHEFGVACGKVCPKGECSCTPVEPVNGLELIELARRYALIHQTRLWLKGEQYAVAELLVRLANEVGGATK